MAKNREIVDKLRFGNYKYMDASMNPGDISPAVRKDTADNGQHPGAIVITCSDSRVIPEAIFSCGIGRIFTIRVAGNVISDSVMGSIEYAAGHLGCKVIVVLGHTNCGAVGATIGGGAEGFTKVLTDEIKKAIGDEKDDYMACGLNVQYGVDRINEVLKDNKEVDLDKVDVLGAIYNIKSGNVEWIP